jgi:hypothetical protein
MGFEITDGTGKGNSAGVDRTNRLLVRNISETLFQNAAEEGEAFFIGTPIITATTAGESALIYIKNNEDSQLILGSFFLIAEATASGSPNMFRVNWYRNPTSISSGTAIPALNQNFGSSNTLDADIEYGAEGSTVTGGSLAATLSFPIGQFNELDANLVLEKGSSLVITVTPPAGNTNMPVQFGTRTIKYIEQY